MFEDEMLEFKMDIIYVYVIILDEVVFVGFVVF